MPGPGTPNRPVAGRSTQVECMAQATAAPSLLRVLRPKPVPLQRTLEQAASNAASSAASAQRLIMRPQQPRPVVQPQPAPPQQQWGIHAEQHARPSNSAVEPQPHASSSAAAAADSSSAGVLQEPCTPAQLLVQLHAAGSWQELRALYHAHAQQFSVAHTHALLQQLGACSQLRLLSQQQRQQLGVLLATATSTVLDSGEEQALTPAQVVGIPHALIALPYRPPGEWVQALMARAYTHMESYSLEELVQLVQAAAALRCTTSDAQSSSSSPLAASPTASGGPACYAVSCAWLRRYMSVVERRLGRRSSSVTVEQLQVLAVSLGALGAEPPRSLLYVFVRALSAAMLSAASQAQPPRGLVAIVSALASWQYRLPEHVAHQFERAVSAGLGRLRAGELASALHALAVLRHRPTDAWTAELLGAALRGSTHLSVHGVAALVAAAAALQYQLQPDALDVLLLQARHALAALSAPECIGLLDGLSQQQYRPGAGFMSSYMEEASRHLPTLSFEQLSALIGGLAGVAYKPPPQWMSDYMRALLAHAPAPADVPSLMRLLAALHKLQYSPPGEVMGALEAQIDRLALQLDFDPIQRLRDALGSLQYEAYTSARAAAIAAAELAAVAEAEAAAAAEAEGEGSMGASGLEVEGGELQDVGLRGVLAVPPTGAEEQEAEDSLYGESGGMVELLA